MIRFEIEVHEIPDFWVMRLVAFSDLKSMANQSDAMADHQQRNDWLLDVMTVCTNHLLEFRHLNTGIY